MSFIDGLLTQLQDAGSRPVVTEARAEGPRPVSGSDLARRVACARATLQARGVKPGDRVALLAPNSADWIAADLALLAHGAVVVPLYVRQAPEELVFVAQDAGCVLVITATEALGAAMGAAGLKAPRTGLSDIFAAEPLIAPVAPRTPDEPVTFIYTSGTSGPPKGVITTTANVEAMLPVTATALSDLLGAVPGQERVFHYLPLCFAGSRLVMWTTLYRGQQLWLSTDLDRLMDEIGQARPHYFLNVPILLERVKTKAEAALRSKPAPIAWLYERALAASERRRSGLHSRRDALWLALADRLLFAPIRAKLGGEARFLICGSAPLSAEVQHWFAMLGLPVYQVYGLTETTAIVTMDKPGQERPGTVGYPIPNAQVRLSDEGELQVRGPHITPGYHGRPDATAAAFTDGWFRTGDRCTLDDDGRLTVIGRVRNLLVPSSGHNVPPEPVELALQDAIPGLEQAVLIGHGRPFLTAILTGDVPREAIEAGVAEVNGTLPFYKRVRAWHHRQAPLTDAEGLLTANGKLRRDAIHEAFAEAIDAMYA